MQESKASTVTYSFLSREQKEKFIPASAEFILTYGDKNSDWSLIPEIDLTAVFYSNVQVTLVVPYLFTKFNTATGVERENGLSDIEIDAKWKFLDRKKYALALLSALILPNGNENKGLGDGSTSLMVGGVASVKTADEFTVSGQVGFQYNSKNLKDFVGYGISGKYDISEKLNVFGKINGHTSAVKGSNKNTVVATIGTDYSFLKDKGQVFCLSRKWTFRPLELRACRRFPES